MSIRTKLILMMLVMSILSIIVVGFQGYRNGKQALRDRINSQLTSQRYSKTKLVEGHFEQLQDELQVLCTDPTVAEAMREFRNAFRQLKIDDLGTSGDQRQARIRALEGYYDGFYAGRENWRGLVPKTVEAEYLQHLYLVENPNEDRDELVRADDVSYYSTVHGRYHSFLSDIARRFSYRELYLIERESLAVVYSIFKDPDFGTRLQSGNDAGPYSETVLAQVARKVSENPGRPEEPLLTMGDFESYLPAAGIPAGFMAGPIFSGNECVGVLAVQIPFQEIDRVISGSQSWEAEGLGKTGEVYLVGSDFRMRSNPRPFLEAKDSEEELKLYLDSLRSINIPEDRLAAIEAKATAVLNLEVRTDPVDQALEKNEGVMVSNDYRSVSVLSSFGPVNVPDVEWVILSQMDAEEAFAPTRQFLKELMISASVQTLLITFLALVFTHLFLRPIAHLVHAVRRLAKGEREVSVRVHSKDELGELGSSFNEMVSAIEEKNQVIEAKTRENESLLLNLVPGSVADRIQQGEKDIADSFPHVTVMFAGLVGFDEQARRSAPQEVIHLLNQLITSYDTIVEQFGVEKVRTTGASYVAACGLSVARLDHARRAFDAALEMLRVTDAFSQENRMELKLRIGMDSGSVVAGVVGTRKFVYDLWGDPVNLANQIRYDSRPGTIQVSQRVYERLQDPTGFEACSTLRTQTLGDVPTWRFTPQVIQPAEAEEF